MLLLWVDLLYHPSHIYMDSKQLINSIISITSACYNSSTSVYMYVNPLLHYIITYVTLIRHLHLHIRNGSVTVVVTVCVVTVVVDVISAAPPYKLHHNIALLPFFMSLPSKYPLRSTSTSSILIFTTALIKVLHPLEPKLVDAVAEHHQLRGRVQGHFGSQHSLLLRPLGRHYWRRHVDTLLHALQNTAIPAKWNSGLISRL